MLAKRSSFSWLIVILSLCSSTQSSSWRTLTLQRECSGLDAPLMNNIGYVLSGYDIYYGNPVPTSGVNLVDPGFRGQIFNAEYNGETTADNRYCTPDGLSILSCDGNCAFSFDTEIIKGTHSYYNKLTEGTGFDLNAFGAAFGASQDYEQVKQYTEDGMHMFTQSEISCCVYTSELYAFTPPKFHRNFLGGLATLTDEYEPYVYRRFLKEFGTHYVARATMGALYGEQSMISREDWTEMIVEDLDIDFYAGMSGLGSINASFTYDKNITDTFHKFTKERKIYSRGAVPPEDGQHLSWAENTFDEPHVLSVALEPIDSLPMEEYINESVKANLRMALETYCLTLKEEGELSSCEAPEPDPPGPKPRVWSSWSNDRSGGDYPLQECPEGQFVEKMDWKYQGSTYGLMDFKMKCSGEDEWRDPAIGNDNGEWDGIMDCDSGFKLVTGREEYWAGIVNVRVKCVGMETQMLSNDDMRGNWNLDLEGRNDGQQIVGVQVRKETHHGIVNFRILWA